MRRQFPAMIITAIALVTLGGCGSTSVNISSTRSPEPVTTPATSEQPPEAPKAPTKAEAQTVSQPVTKLAAHASQANRAEEVLSKAREALGGEAKFKEVQNLTVSGSLRRDNNGQEQSGQKRMDLLLPDKFKTSDTIGLVAGIELTIVSALNGNQTWSDARTSAGNAQVMMMPGPGNEQQNNEEQTRGLRAQFTRYLLALFLMPPPDSSIEFGGEAEAPDGRADIVVLKDASGVVGKLFIDQKTHRPLMMTYRDFAPRTKTKKLGVADAGSVDKLVKDAQAKAPPREKVDMQMYFSDYKPEKGILLPHLITITINDKPSEEWVLKSFKVNSPDLTPKAFEKEK